MISARLTKKTYTRQARALNEKLLQANAGLKDAGFKVLVILAGPEGAGRGELLHTLTGWLDPRGVETFSYHPPTDEEEAHPHQWRFWRSLPAIGRIGLYAGSWYTETLREHARSKRAEKDLAHEAQRIREFEQLLSDSGTVVIKVWLHLSKKAQGRRLRALQDDRRNAWRVTEEEWHHHRIYDRLDKTARFIRARTHLAAAPWVTIDAEDERHRDLAVGRLILNRIREQQRRLARAGRGKLPAPRSLRPAGLRKLKSLALDRELSDDDYEILRERWLGRLNLAVRGALSQGRSIVFVFEGWDAAGKGGAIRRLTTAMDPRDYTVIPVGKPTHEEKQFHYLWRFWRRVPRAGRVAIFDRSWYGRVLVERVEGFCKPADWRRAFGEINDFERQLAEHGTIVLKYWLEISHEEQLRRFREREATPHKRHKMTAEDWRNRRKRIPYEIAIGDMVALTSPASAPWNLIAANNKKYARIEVLRTATQRIEASLAQ